MQKTPPMLGLSLTPCSAVHHRQRLSLTQLWTGSSEPFFKEASSMGPDLSLHKLSFSKNPAKTVERESPTFDV